MSKIGGPGANSEIESFTQASESAMADTDPQKAGRVRWKLENPISDMLYMIIQQLDDNSTIRYNLNQLDTIAYNH